MDQANYQRVAVETLEGVLELLACLLACMCTLGSEAKQEVTTEKL